jgi:hypothetical protein
VQSNILTPSFSPPGSETVHKAVDSSPAALQHVSVYHRCLYIPMPEEFLNGADTVAIFQGEEFLNGADTVAIFQGDVWRTNGVACGSWPAWSGLCFVRPL